ncbi:helix-turn-helix domain-containing protein [Streptomyces sp. NPDC001698]|uniref:helix-turn-helix domain-containing protein n=1 Tax=Streptomyces sp. NPDC001698 TaxID=3364601 RepID=UPI00367CF105
MVPVAATTRSACTRAPRARGDGPAGDGAAGGPLLCSPRPRGWSRAGQAGLRAAEVARRLRISPKLAYQWQKAWRDGGAAALTSLGPVGQRCKLSQRCLEKLAAYLDEGPAAHGWDQDQVWTGARVATLIGRKFHVWRDASLVRMVWSRNSSRDQGRIGVTMNLAASTTAGGRNVHGDCRSRRILEKSSE